MILFLWKYTCINGHEFEVPQLDEFEYGTLLLRNELNEIQYVCLGNKAFDEIDRLVSGHPLVSHFEEGDLTDVVQSVFSVACDINIHGGPFKIARRQSCPQCSTRMMDDWDQIIPFKPVEVDVKEVTHNHWFSLSEAEKKSLVDTAILKELKKTH
ncbi:hypothetical protein [Candidatus Berkiella aquae]|uniref:Uncharacterized protein n=1 Tax=Candidatus Berkiella aquae TaxID=295108 RepID=A0A0Q9YYD7_9GAMM|nr:hypothetical protein [Candidatus Berkiella aquae]MCS5710540.1 hypothetical protein [Candidatus Berkiella aquae]